MSSAIELSVVVLAYNEAPTLHEACDEIAAALAGLGCSYELLIVDDGSTDDTPIVARAIACVNEKVRIVSHGLNLGLGGGYRTGFQEARGRFLTFFPADGQFPASIIDDFYPRAQRLDLVLGYLPQRAKGLGRLLSIIERALYRVLLGPIPRFQGIMMIRRELLQRIPLASTGRGWAVVMEFILKAARSGARIESVPTPVRPRTHGVSKVNNWRTITANLRQLIVLRQHVRDTKTVR